MCQESARRDDPRGPGEHTDADHRWYLFGMGEVVREIVADLTAGQRHRARVRQAAVEGARDVERAAPDESSHVELTPGVEGHVRSRAQRVATDPPTRHNIGQEPPYRTVA